MGWWVGDCENPQDFLEVKNRKGTESEQESRGGVTQSGFLGSITISRGLVDNTRVQKTKVKRYKTILDPKQVHKEKDEEVQNYLSGTSTQRKR